MQGTRVLLTECMFVISMDRQCRPLLSEERYVVRSACLLLVQKRSCIPLLCMGSADP
jgi:hypothetical protein